MTSTVSETGKTVPVWAAYKTDASVFDEMLDLSSQPRSGCAAVIETMFSMPPAQFTEICARADRMFRRMGVTFNVYGAADGSERIFPFDPIPRVIDAATWATLEAGLIQRVRALNAFVADVYGDGCILSDDVVPRDLVQGCPQFRRAAVGIKPPLGNFVTVAGIDLVRGVDGRFYVLEDNVRTPSGVSYVIENRVVMTRLVPTLMRASRVRSVERYPADLLQCLMEMSPDGQIQSDHRAAHARSLQFGVLRARLPVAADGHRAGRRPGPGLRRSQTLHEGRSRAAADRRPLSPHRRRLPRPAGLPLRFAARRRRPDRSAARRQRRDRQRSRHRSRRRQGGLRVHARDDSLLSRRRTDSADRRDLTCCAIPMCASRC